MAHAQAERAFPQSPTYPVAAVAAAIAAILVAATLALTALEPFGSERPMAGTPNQALLDAEARWELHRKLQSGDMDARIRAEREWELHRKLQSGAFE